MKKSSFSLPMIITMVSTIIIVVIAYLYQVKNDHVNDNKSKLTLLKSAKKVPGLKNLIEQNLARQQEQANNQASSEIFLQTERLYTEAELKDMTEEQFMILLKDTEGRLPKISDIKKIPSQALHRTPPIVLQAGRDLGLIKEILKLHESYERVAAPFYKNCAKNAEGSTPVRALCLTNLIEIKKKNNQEINMSDFPGNIIELSKMVTEI